MNTSDDFLAAMFEGATSSQIDTPVDPGFSTLDNLHIPPTDDDGADDTEDSVDNTPDAPPIVDDVLVGYVDFLKQNDLIEIPEDLQFTGSSEELQKIFEHTKATKEAAAVDKIFQALPEDFKPLLDYALKGGASLDEFLSVYGKDPLQNIDLTKIEDQRKVIAQHYKATSNYSDEKIARLVSLITDEDDIRIEAEDCFKDLAQMRQEDQKNLLVRTEAAKVAAIEAAEEKTTALVRAVETTTAIHPQRKQKVRSFFFDPISVAGNNTTGFNYAIQSILANPEHQAQLADILLEYNPSSGFSAERFEKRAKTKAADQFQDLLNKTLNPKQAQRASTSKTPNSNKLDWETYLKQ